MKLHFQTAFHPEKGFVGFSHNVDRYKEASPAQKWMEVGGPQPVLEKA